MSKIQDSNGLLQIHHRAFRHVKTLFVPGRNLYPAGLLLVIQGLFILRQRIRHARYRFLGARRFVPMRFGSHMEFVSIYMFWTIRIIFQAGNSLNAVEHKPVSTRVLNPNASEVSYKPKQQKNRKTKLKLFSLLWYESSICLGANFPRHETSRTPDFYLGRIQFQHVFVLPCWHYYRQFKIIST